MSWGDLGVVPTRAARRGGLVGPIVFAAFLAFLVATGRYVAAAVLLAVGFAVGQAVLVSPRFGRALRDGLATFGRVVGHGVAIVLLAPLFVLVFLPAAGLAALLRRPLRPSTAGDAGRWADHTPTDPPRPARPFAADRGPRTETRVGLALRVVGVVAFLALLDVALGATLASTGVLRGEQGDLRAQQADLWHTAMASPAAADEPWAADYAESMIDLGVDAQAEYVPFLVWGNQEFHSPYMNSTGVERVSYRPAVPAGTEPLQVAFLGGSALFGIGQRDEHTIPSEFARLAEAADVPVQVHNYGVSGWVAWQEMLQLERLLAHGGHYDLVVVYDGFNDLVVQQSDYSRDPTHSGLEIAAELRRNYQEEHDSDTGLLDGPRALLDAYRDTSALVAVARELTEDPTDDDLFNASLTTASPEEQDAATVEVYGRAKDLMVDLARDHDTPIRFFWQARREAWPPDLLAHLPDGVTDLTDVFAGVDQPIFIDSAHTNELGARVVAEALWAEVGDDLRDQLG